MRDSVGCKWIYIKEVYRHNGTEKNVNAEISVYVTVGNRCSSRIEKVRVNENASDRVIKNRVKKIMETYNKQSILLKEIKIMELYEIILRSPNGIEQSMGIFNREETIKEQTRIRNELSAKYGKKVANAFGIHVCYVELGDM